MATHSSVLAWRIPGTGEPGGVMGSHRVGHNWSDLAAAAAVGYTFVSQGCEDFSVEREKQRPKMGTFPFPIPGLAWILPEFILSFPWIAFHFLTVLPLCPTLCFLIKQDRIILLHVTKEFLINKDYYLLTLLGSGQFILSACLGSKNVRNLWWLRW